jgi:hypothetical protein
MLAADSCIGILEWSSGYLLSRHGLVRPKHGSTALLLELLDEEGARPGLAGGCVRAQLLGAGGSGWCDEGPPWCLRFAGRASHAERA